MMDIGPMLNNATNMGNNQVMAIMKMIQESNMSPKDLFYQKAKEMNVDPEEILSMLRMMK